MNVEKYKVEKEKAAEEWKAYLQAHRETKEKVYRDLASVYGHMKEGRAVIDVIQAMRDAGLRDGGYPQLGVCRADYKEVYFKRENPGRGYFTGRNVSKYPYATGKGKMGSLKEDVVLSANTFRDWTEDESRWEPSIGRTMVPMIPAKFVPRGDYRNYYILWEAESWVPVGPAKVTRPPRDPFLMRRISPTMFAILASWDLSPLERAVIAGRIA